MDVMENVTRIAVDRGIGSLTIDSPPVNALGVAVRRGLAAGLKELSENDGIRAIIIICSGRTFFAGADISEFGKPPQKPSLPAVLKHIENCPKPVIAAIHGTALGGGYELALNCHYRVAVPSAKIGLPEVKLGLLPGAGGTQRLPRLVGPEMALEVIVHGSPVSAPDALNVGMIDALAREDELLRDATFFAEKAIAENLPLRRVRDRQDKIEPGAFDPDIFDRFRKANAKSLRGFKAPNYIVSAVEAAVSLPFDEGIAREQALFYELRDSPESAAQRYYFFAKRSADKSFATTGPSEDMVAGRLTAALIDQVNDAITDGTSPEQIDNTLYDYGFPSNYLTSIGIDVDAASPNGHRTSQFADPGDQLLKRLLLPVAEEGQLMIEEGIVLNASDIDVAAINGCHWPVYQGGPMFWANSIELPEIVVELEMFSSPLDKSKVH